MEPNRAVLFAVVLIAGGGLPWLASVASLKLLDNQSGLPLLAGQTLTMPLVALSVWLVVRRLWAQQSRLAAIALILGVWLVPSLWILLTDNANSGKPMTAAALPSFLAVSPAILSVYMLNSIGLVATLASLSIAAMWRMRDTSSGAEPAAAADSRCALAAEPPAVRRLTQMNVRKVELRNGVAMVGSAWVSFFIATLLWSPLVLITADRVEAEPGGTLAMAVRVTLGVIGGSLAGSLFGYVLETRRRLAWCIALGAYTAWLFTGATRTHSGPSDFGFMLNVWPGIAAGLAAVAMFPLGQRWQGGSND